MNESQIINDSGWGATVAAQTGLSVATPSPVTLTFSSVQSGKIHVAVRMAASDSITSVTDDAGNVYTLIDTPTINSDRWEVWESDAQPMNGCVITATGNLLWAMLSAINT